MEKKRCLHSPSYLIFKKSRRRVEDAELLDIKGVYLDFCLFSLLAGIVFLRYHNVLSNSWLNDETQILKHAISYQPWEYFFPPRVWQKLSASNFTPWITFSFDVDWMIFDLHPYGFYLHHLISLCSLASIAYIVLRLWFSALFSFLGVLLFAVSPSVAETAPFLMECHYLEGLIFALLSLYLFVKAVRNIDARWTIVSAFFTCAPACPRKSMCLYPQLYTRGV
jgi:hypothetical protein